MVAAEFYVLCSDAAKQAAAIQKIADAMRNEIPDVSKLDEAVSNLREWMIATLNLAGTSNRKERERQK